MKLNITNDVTSADLEQLRKKLISYNVPHFEPVDEKPLGIFYDDDAGVRRAGLTGKLFGNWLLIDLLWVEDSLRSQGVGSSLLQAAEDAARDYGAKRVFLNTFRFQAPDFYLKHGLLHLLSILPERAERNKEFEVDDLLPWSEEMKSWFSAV